MTQIESKILEDLEFMKNKIIELDEEFHSFQERWEDSQVTPRERERIQKDIVAINKGKTSEFISLTETKKKLGI